MVNKNNIKSILFLLHLPPPVHGSSIIGKTIYDSEFINTKFKCSYINLLASKDVASTGKLSFFKLMGFVKTFFILLHKLKNVKPLLCYYAITATGAAFFKDVLLIFILKLFKVKLVYHMHNKGVRNYKDNFFYRICYKYVFYKSEVILLSSILYSDIDMFVPKNRIHICPNGISEIIKIENTNENSNRNQFSILFLSNLIETKGVYILIEACYLLKNKGYEFNCIFIGGEGDINKELFEKKTSELDLNEIVKYEGKKYGLDKVQYFKNASVFVFPTYYQNETFGLVNLEAMQYSLPIISTYEGGIPDIVEDGITGFLVPQRNVQQLADKIEILINNRHLATEMGKAGRKKYENKFTIDIFENRLVSILENI